LPSRGSGSDAAAARPAGAGARSAAPVRPGPSAPGARPPAGADAGNRAAGARAARLRPRSRRPVRPAPGAAAELAAAARAPACAAGRRCRAADPATFRPPSGARFPAATGQTPRIRHSDHGVASDLAAAAADPAARSVAAHPRRSRAHRKRLVGRRRHPPRLLRRRNLMRPARLGILRRGRAWPVPAARLVRLSTACLNRADRPMVAPDYAELHCLSAFSFGRGASTARELFDRAKALGYTALAITDEASLAGIVRAHEAAQESGLRLIVGSEFRMENGPRLVLLVENHAGYVRLCAL